MDLKEGDKFKDKRFKDITDKVNPEFFEWIKKSLNLDVSRALLICTYLLNYNIAENYFPSISRYQEQHSYRRPPKISAQQIAEFRITFEKIFSIITWFVLNYKQRGKILSKSATDSKINKISFSGPLVKNFFAFNTVPPYVEMKMINNILKNYEMVENFVPNLEFDPEFKKILDHKSFQHILVKTSPEFMLDAPLSETLDYETPIDSTVFKPPERIYNVNPELRISYQFFNFFNEMGVMKLGIAEVIDDAISLLSKYYSRRIPLRAEEIRLNLNCFGELLKLTKGKLYLEVSYQNFISHLKEFASEEYTSEFVENFGYQKNFNDFYKSFEEFDPKQFLLDYHQFLSHPFYVYSGIIRTGAFLAWRGLVKYLESLHRGEEFRNQKGTLLETWCYNKALELGYKDIEKIVLIDTNKEPTDRYLNMKKQISLFPKEPLEIPVIFPEQDDKYYREIDLVIKIGNYLLAIECKGTAAPVQETPKIVSWMRRTEEDFAWLQYKCRIISNNLEQNKINHPFLKYVVKILPFQVRTEGMFSLYGDLTPSGFEGILKDFGEKINNGTIIQHLEDITKKISN